MRGLRGGHCEGGGHGEGGRMSLDWRDKMGGHVLERGHACVWRGPYDKRRTVHMVGKLGIRGR